MTTVDKNLWRERWLGCMNELTSLDLQKKSWLDRTHTNPHWSFIEFMNSYFNDLVIDDNYKESLESGLVSKQEFKIIKEWHESLDKYNPPKNDDSDNEAVLKDSEWLKILQIGVDAKNKLAETLIELEKQLLTEKINYLKYV